MLMPRVVYADRWLRKGDSVLLLKEQLKASLYYLVLLDQPHAFNYTHV